MKLNTELQVPTDIMEAADKVAAWAKLNGFTNWMIGPVADREYLERTLDELEDCDYYSQFADPDDD